MCVCMHICIEGLLEKYEIFHELRMPYITAHTLTYTAVNVFVAHIKYTPH